MKNLKVLFISLPFALASITASAVNGYDVKQVQTNYSSFYQIDDTWYEKGADNSHKFVFTEVARDSWSVYLYDSNRNVSLQLDLWRNKVLYSTGKTSGGGSNLYTITESQANQVVISGPTLYQNQNYKGYSVQLGEGSYTLNVLQARGIVNDDISSVKVPGGFQIDTYQHNNFGGWEQSYIVDTSYVGSSKNDELSSVIVSEIPSIKNKYLSIQRHTNAPSFSNSEADSILSDATNILTTQDSGDDVACPTRMKRTGSVTTFTAGDGTLDTNADMGVLPDGINLVQAINYCGGLSPNIIGCANLPGTKMAVVRYDSNKEGIIWAHEYGHNTGLSHRSGDNYLMNGYITTSMRSINQTECDSFLNN